MSMIHKYSIIVKCSVRGEKVKTAVKKIWL